MESTDATAAFEQTKHQMMHMYMYYDSKYRLKKNKERKLERESLNMKKSDSKRKKINK